MFIADESLRNPHSVRSAMFGTVDISVLAERRQFKAVVVYKRISLFRKATAPPRRSCDCCCRTMPRKFRSRKIYIIEIAE